MISKKKDLRRNPKAFSSRKQKFKRFFRPETGDLKKKKKVFAEIHRLLQAESRNLNGFSGQKQQLFPPQKPAIKSRWGHAEISNWWRRCSLLRKNTVGGQEINRGGKNKNCWRRAWQDVRDYFPLPLLFYAQLYNFWKCTSIIKNFCDVNSINNEISV